MRYALAAVAALVACAPAGAYVVQADIAGTVNGGVYDYQCDGNSCGFVQTQTLTGTAFTGTIDSNSPQHNFSFSVNGLDPITYNSALAGAGTVGDDESLNNQFLTFRYHVAGAEPFGNGRSTATTNLTFDVAPFTGAFTGATGTLTDAFNLDAGATQRQYRLTIATAVVTGGVSGPDVNGIPEPATWALLLIGFGGIGSVLRRRRGQALEHGASCRDDLVRARSL